MMDRLSELQGEYDARSKKALLRARIADGKTIGSRTLVDLLAYIEKLEDGFVDEYEEGLADGYADGWDAGYAVALGDKE